MTGRLKGRQEERDRVEDAEEERRVGLMQGHGGASAAQVGELLSFSPRTQPLLSNMVPVALK